MKFIHPENVTRTSCDLGAHQSSLNNDVQAALNAISSYYPNLQAFTELAKFPNHLKQVKPLPKVVYAIEAEGADVVEAERIMANELSNAAVILQQSTLPQTVTEKYSV